MHPLLPAALAMLLAAACPAAESATPEDELIDRVPVGRQAVARLVSQLALGGHRVPAGAWGVMPALGAHVGVPQVASVTIGALLDDELWRWTNQSNITLTGGLGIRPLVRLEPGVAGGKAGVGIASFWLAEADPLLVPGAGWSLSANVLRTWGDPWAVAANQTFVGGELGIHVLGVNLRLGPYWRTAGGARDENWFLGGSIGFGF